MEFLRWLFQPKASMARVELTKRFDLIGRIGQGTMSQVWRARDSLSGNLVALKVLDKEKTKALEARFVGRKKPSEGEIALGLRHPNIVRTLEHGITTENEQFLVMEFIEGETLTYLIEVQNERMRKNCLSYIIQIADGLSYIHQKKYIYRDLCPRNIIVEKETNRIKLIDFGLVVPNTPEFQAPGNRTGTANFMAPELIKRVRTDQRIDLFSFSVTAYLMLTKQLPWKASVSLEHAIQHINTPPKPISNFVPDLDPELAEIIMKGLERDPDDRWQTSAELGSALQQVEHRLKMSAPK